VDAEHGLIGLRGLLDFIFTLFSRAMGSLIYNPALAAPYPVG